MEYKAQLAERRTSADVVFSYLYDEIVSLRLLPGAKISEAEIANKFEVSRQPVREAFSRLGNMELLNIRPQRATEVKRFSYQSIQAARFVRAAVEMAVLREAVRTWDGSALPELKENIEAQKAAVEKIDIDTFHTLDYEFHRGLCRAGKVEFAFEEIAQKKALVDRLCVLSMMRQDRMAALLEDHTRILECVMTGDEEGALSFGRLHLNRLDTTIEAIRASHTDYFD